MIKAPFSLLAPPREGLDALSAAITYDTAIKQMPGYLKSEWWRAKAAAGQAFVPCLEVAIAAGVISGLGVPSSPRWASAAAALVAIFDNETGLQPVLEPSDFRDPARIVDWVYEGVKKVGCSPYDKNPYLGNKPPFFRTPLDKAMETDPVKFRGRGYLQVTGRANYTYVMKALYERRDSFTPKLRAMLKSASPDGYTNAELDTIGRDPEGSAALSAAYLGARGGGHTNAANPFYQYNSRQPSEIMLQIIISIGYRKSRPSKSIPSRSDIYAKASELLTGLTTIFKPK